MDSNATLYDHMLIGALLHEPKATILPVLDSLPEGSLYPPYDGIAVALRSSLDALADNEPPGVLAVVAHLVSKNIGIVVAEAYGQASGSTSYWLAKVKNRWSRAEVRKAGQRIAAAASDDTIEQDDLARIVGEQITVMREAWTR